MNTPQVENIVIIGSGPAGFTAAIYAARANLKPVMFEGLKAGGVPGGQLMTTTEVENFPGFPEGITGPQLMQQMKLQAERWGTECYTEDVIEVDLSKKPFTVCSTERVVKANSIIIATGATAKRLGLPSEKTYWNNGISACAICDGAAPIFIGEELVVIGGGDSAAEEAVYLTKYGSHVHLLVRRGEMRASKAMQDRVIAHPKITVHWFTEAIDVFGENGRMTGVKVRSRQTRAQTDILAKGLFYAIGHNPNTSLFSGQLEFDTTGFMTGQLGFDSVGYIKVQPGTVETSVPGVFAGGDVQDYEYRQAITAAGTGCMAALSAERYLSKHNLIREHAQKPVIAKEKITKIKSNQVSDNTFDINATRYYGGYALKKLFHKSDRLLMVKYGSAACSLSKTLKPMLDKVVSEYEDKIHFVEIDILEDPQVTEMGQVTGTPTVQFFSNQELVKEMRGVKQKTEYRTVIDSCLSNRVATARIPQTSKNNFDVNATRHYGGYALKKLFHESDRLLVVKYVSPNCGPCQTLKPMLDKVVSEYEGKIYFVEIDIVEDSEVAKMGQVIGTPTVQFFHNQELVKEMKGIKQKTEYRTVIDSYLTTATK